MSREIIAAVARGAAEPFTIERLTLATPRAGEVVVRLVASGICQSDLTAKHNFPAELPIVLGHETAGVVEQLGSEVTGIEVGDHVLVTYASCGNCRRCDAGLPGYCDHWVRLNGGRYGANSPLTTTDGQPVVGGFFGQSSFATHLVASARSVVVVDQDLDLTLIAAFGCGVQTGAGAVVNVLQPESDSAVAIFGVGGVGISAVMAARALGVSTVIAVDLSADRLHVAGELGATTLIDGAADDVATQIRAATGDGTTHALDTTGIDTVVATAIESLAPRGTLAVVGLGEPVIPIEVAKLIGLGKTVRGSIEGDADPHRFLPQLIDWYRTGKLPMDRIIRRYPLEAINAAVADCARGEVIKSVLTFAEL
ncbi:NAD(P)-dependent alcohol dehydrogenase [Skermania piniformis]|uniref:NAD(P)-dependent alcohol dehydrogenase n=1 Tax=Skermania pinensis TaxID=39122 RepID=A0ABX8S599_9ACTN|nr:NAD(P)-dependent alcohol dehydrogenase [Skermania piniformis]QXQ12928.1 NAD(P)-dependent alcohol dehydrogenase [Skermania piniformis]